jgi:MYXO-CTERM domain-containing protein
MKLRNSAATTLLLLTTSCENDPGNSPRLESPHLALGTAPATESATWTRIGAPSSPLPNPRYMQAAAVDEDRQVLVMFGGWSGVSSDNGGLAASQDVWEWNPATGAWTNLTPAGTKPSPRAGATMVYDSLHKNFVIFGGRSTSGYDYEDTWVWDPASATFTDATTSGPSARSQHTMVFEKSTGKILLFGGGRADAGSSIWPETDFYSDPIQRPRSGASPDGTGIALAFGDTWEWDPSAGSWTQLTPTATPSARYDSTLVWDSKRNLAVLFGGIQKDQADENGIPQADTWEWNPTAKAWNLRPTTATTPKARWGHAMAYDPVRGLIVLAGGKSWQTYLGLGEVWDWDPATGNWAQRLTGNESGVPAGRMYASLLSDSLRSRLDLVAGITFSTSLPFGAYQPTASGEVWEFEPASAKFTNRSAVQSWPSQRWGNAITFCPANGKTYLFGGQSPNYDLLNDLWEWDGSSWSQVPGDVRPTRRANPAMAYDPSRKSLIMFGGLTYPSAPFSEAALDLCDTWEWSSATRAWSQLFPMPSPPCTGGAGIVTDSGRARLLLFGGDGPSNAVWEWDGAKTTWTNRTPAPGAVTPGSRGGTEGGPLMAFDDGRQKMFLFEGDSTWQGTTSNSVFWEWDPLSAGWALRDSGDFVDLGTSPFPVVAYDSLRRRMVVPSNATDVVGSTTAIKTWELDSKGPTWYLRDLATGPTTVSAGPGWYYSNATMAFDSQRGVMVLFGAGPNDGSALSETWEYKVKSLGNGEGCTAATASNCASGFCVDGVCCSTVSCLGVCQSCSVAGKEGICTSAAPGTEVSGSCADGQACAAGGGCKAKNGTPCSSASACASGVCVDGVCCDGPCDGTCVSCNQASRAGKCSPYAAGSDPQNECGLGSGVCRSTCNGAGACDYPQSGTPCGPCQVCDGNGVCWLDSTPYLCNTGGSGGGGAGGAGGAGGSGGSSIGGTTIGGAGGLATGGAGGSIIGSTTIGGAGGLVSGGAGGHAGSGGSIIGSTTIGGAGGLVSGGAGGSIVGGVGGAVSGGAGGRGSSGVAGTSVAGAGGAGGVTSGGSGGHTGTISGGADGNGDAGGANSSPDAGSDSIPTDAGRPDGRRDAHVPDTGSTGRLGHKGCDCDLGHTPADRSGLPLALLGVALFWRRRRR